MKKNLLFLLLVLGVTFSSCKKDTPVVTDNRDKFVGTWNGTTNAYEAGVLFYSGATTYSITKDANNSNRILINDAANGIVNVPATVNGSSYSISNFTVSDGSSSFVVNGTGALSGNTIIENGSQVETDLTTGDVYNYTYTTNLSK